MTAYIIQDTDKVSNCFVRRAKGIANGRIASHPKGTEVELVETMIRGMTDNGQPGWATSGLPIEYRTYEEAADYLDRSQRGSGWDFDMIEGSAVIRERVIRSLIQITEFDSDT